MPTFELPAATAVPPPTPDDNGLSLSAGQQAMIAIAAAAFYAASRGKVDQAKAEKAIRFAVKGFVGIGGVHMATGVKEHQPRPPYGPTDPPPPITPLTPGEQRELSTLESPSGKYFYLVSRRTGERTRVPLELLGALIEAGIVKWENRVTFNQPRVIMAPLWNADP